MELVSMAAEPGESSGAIAAPMSMSPYPYGLRLNLTMPELSKLGYSEMPPAGAMVRLEAVACVVRVTSEDPDADGDCDYCCVELQIKELGIEEEEGEGSGQPKDQDATAKRMYGKVKQAA